MNSLNWKIPIAVAVVAVCIVAIYTISQREEKEKQKIIEKSTTQIRVNEKNGLMPIQKKRKQEFGQRQSPINIISKSDDINMNETKLKNIDDDDFESNPLKILYPKQVKDCTIINNGHTVQINIAEHNECTLTVHDKTYSLKQFHFHIPSEHRIDGKQYEMEMHLVHINENDEIAVLGMIFTKTQKHFIAKLRKSRSGMHLTLENNAKKTHVQNNNDFLTVTTDDDIDIDSSDDDEKNDNDDDVRNEFLNQFCEQLPRQETEKEIALKKWISFDYLFASSSNGTFSKSVETNEIIVNMELFQYIGSLTTPPYTEGVQWLVSKKLHSINETELNQLSACWGHKNNARSLKDMHGRMVSLRSMRSVTKLSDQ